MLVDGVLQKEIHHLTRQSKEADMNKEEQEQCEKADDRLNTALVQINRAMEWIEDIEGAAQSVYDELDRLSDALDHERVILQAVAMEREQTNDNTSTH